MAFANFIFCTCWAGIIRTTSSSCPFICPQKCNIVSLGFNSGFARFSYLKLFSNLLSISTIMPLTLISKNEESPLSWHSRKIARLAFPFSLYWQTESVPSHTGAGTHSKVATYSFSLKGVQAIHQYLSQRNIHSGLSVFLSGLLSFIFFTQVPYQWRQRRDPKIC